MTFAHASCAQIIRERDEAMTQVLEQRQTILDLRAQVMKLQGALMLERATTP